MALLRRAKPRDRGPAMARSLHSAARRRRSGRDDEIEERKLGRKTMPAHVSLLTPRARQAKFWNKLTETMPRAELDALHLTKLRKLVEYVYSYSPFYRRRFDERGLKPRHIRSIADFKRLVPLT